MCLGMAECCEAKQRSYRREPSVARTDAVLTIVFSMIEKRTDHRGVQITDLELGRFDAATLRRKPDEEPHRVPVGRKRMRTRLSAGARDDL
jgi:hypothetical protein